MQTTNNNSCINFTTVIILKQIKHKNNSIFCNEQMNIISLHNYKDLLVNLLDYKIIKIISKMLKKLVNERIDTNYISETFILAMLKYNLDNLNEHISNKQYMLVQMIHN